MTNAEKIFQDMTQNMTKEQMVDFVAKFLPTSIFADNICNNASSCADCYLNERGTCMKSEPNLSDWLKEDAEYKPGTPVYRITEHYDYIIGQRIPYKRIESVLFTAAMNPEIRETVFLSKEDAQKKLIREIFKQRYTLDQIIDAVTQADDTVIYAVEHKDRELLEKCLKEYLDKEGNELIREVKSEEEAEELQKFFAAVAYENKTILEEQDTHLRLPCRVGETVYRICPKCNDNHNGSCSGCAWEYSAAAHGCLVYGNAGTKTMKCQIVPYRVSWEYLPSLMEDLGKTVFLTRKEAEQRLEEIQKEEENNEQNG